MTAPRPGDPIPAPPDPDEPLTPLSPGDPIPPPPAPNPA